MYVSIMLGICYIFCRKYDKKYKSPNIFLRKIGQHVEKKRTKEEVVKDIIYIFVTF